MNSRQRLIACRIRAGRTRQEMAAALGVSYASYDDLEGYDDDFDYCLDCGQLRALLEFLGIVIGEIFRPDSRFPPRPFQIGELKGFIHAHLEAKGMTLASLEDEVGWELNVFLCDPIDERSISVECLQSLCAVLGLDWTGAFRKERG